MEFFQQLAAAGEGKLDVTLRMMEKDGILTVNLLPGSATSKTIPMIISGTAAELDAEFISKIIPEIKEVGGIITNIDEVKAAKTTTEKTSDTSKGKYSKNTDKAKAATRKKATKPSNKDEEAHEKTQPEEENNDLKFDE